MTYQLSETDKAQLQTLRRHTHLQYREEDALVIEDTIDRALLNGWIDKDDVYELIKMLPKIIPLPNEEVQVSLEGQNVDWNEFIDERRTRYKRTVEQLHQVLTNWIFMQSAVYRKNMESIEGAVDIVKFNNKGHGLVSKMPIFSGQKPNFAKDTL